MNTSLLLVLSAVLLHLGTCQQQQEEEEDNSVGERVCMDKVEMVEELVWETKVKCHHSFRKSCYHTYVTTYVPETEKDCTTDYQKSCFIEYEKTARNLEIEICHHPLTRQCDIEGPEVCTAEHDTVCETEVSSHLVDDDVPECREEFEERCMPPDDDPEGEPVCANIPRQVCKLKQEERRKTKPTTKCTRIRTEVCGPQECPLAQGEEICENVERTVLDEIPTEVCELAPQKVCHDLTRLVPRLTPTRKCVQVPKEVCVKMRVNPRRVRKPVVKTWCTDGGAPPRRRRR